MTKPVIKKLLFVSILFSNNWVIVAFKTDLLVFALIVTTSAIFALYFFFIKRSRKLLLLMVLLFCATSFIYILKTVKHPLFSLDSLERDLQQKRLNSYPSPPIPFVPGRLAYKLPDLMEKSSPLLVIYRFEKNLTNFFDFNYYFFGSYPRENQIPGEFVKFPFVYFPLFAVGCLEVSKSKKYKYMFLMFSFCFAITALVGDKNPIGLFINFPFLVSITYLGLIKTIS